MPTKLRSLNGKQLGSYNKTLNDKTVYETTPREGLPSHRGINHKLQSGKSSYSAQRQSLTQFNSFSNTCNTTSYTNECLYRESTAQLYRFEETPTAQTSGALDSSVHQEHPHLLYITLTNFIRFETIFQADHLLTRQLEFAVEIKLGPVSGF